MLPTSVLVFFADPAHWAEISAAGAFLLLAYALHLVRAIHGSVPPAAA